MYFFTIHYANIKMKEYSQILPLPTCTLRCRRYDSRMETSSTSVKLPPSATDRNIVTMSRQEYAEWLSAQAGIRFTLSPLTGLRQVMVPDNLDSQIIAQRLRNL